MPIVKFGDAQKIASVMTPKSGMVQEICPECNQPTARPITKEAYLKGDKATRQCAKCHQTYIA